MNNDMSEVPCEGCPVICICINKYDLYLPYWSAHNLMTKCEILEEWLYRIKEHESQEHEPRYHISVNILHSYFESLRGENNE